MTKKSVRILKKVLLGLLCFAVLLLTSNAVVNRMTFNPYRDREDTYVFHVLTQLLSPSASCSWLDQNNPHRFTWFGAYTQKLILDQFPEHSTGERTTGTLAYQRGKLSFTDYDDRLGFGSLTYRQDVFMQGAFQKIQDEDIDAQKQYEAWFRLEQPMNSAEFSEHYGWLLDNEKTRPNGSGLLWLAVKTSPDASDLCLGSMGNLSVHYLNNPVFGTLDYDHMDLIGREEVFRQALQYLIDRPGVTQAYQKSGLYPGGENLDFEQRLSYIEHHGIQYLGMVGYLRGDVLLSLKNSGNLSLIKLVER